MAISSKRRLFINFLIGVLLCGTMVLNFERITETNRMLYMLEHWDELEEETKSSIEKMHVEFEKANHGHDHDETDSDHEHDENNEPISDADAIVQDIEPEEKVVETKEKFQPQLGFSKEPPAGDGSMTAELKRLYNHLESISNDGCKDFKYIGTDKNFFTDFSYPVCFDENVWQSESCLVYSFGNDNNWNFENAMIENHSCTVYAFDPNLYDEPDTERSTNLHFKKVGLGDQNQDEVIQRGKRDYVYKEKNGEEALDQARKKPMRTLWGVMREQQHTDKIIDVVKIDREGPRIAYETSALRNLLEDGTYSCIRQLVVELHFFGPIKYPDHVRLTYSVIKGLESVGFKLWKTQASKSKSKLNDLDDFLTLETEKNTFMYTVSFYNQNPKVCH